MGNNHIVYPAVLEDDVNALRTFLAIVFNYRNDFRVLLDLGVE